MKKLPKGNKIFKIKINRLRREKEKSGFSNENKYHWLQGFVKGLKEAEILDDEEFQEMNETLITFWHTLNNSQSITRH